ncbi:GGDEF domain-containing protein [uncultured Desulfobacter sp.]|uniref:GGDEF domain-containing protein n=1 Tax=uncultured Desulfobacter sp. TaxID=240139 RepID=UPI002AAB42DC|nr:GGDEF domain-containing protein [uncultured Desulfobacter sp.]
MEGSLLYLIMVSFGFSAGSVSAFHQLQWAPPIFITSSMIPQIIYFLSLQSKSNIVVAAMMAITIIFMSIISMKQHKNWIRTLALSFELQVAKKEAERIARIDILTGIYNRRAFYEIAPKYIAAAKRSNSPLSVVMLDIDHFKSINDTYGHAVGDMVLASIANMLKHEIRESDIVGRLGGEEFVILLPDSDRNGAFKIVERLRQKVQIMNFPGYDFNVTSSFGIVVNTAHESIDHLLKNADSALYDAKNRGRNQTVVYEQPGIE